MDCTVESDWGLGFDGLKEKNDEEEGVCEMTKCRGKEKKRKGNVNLGGIENRNWRFVPKHQLKVENVTFCNGL